MKAYVDSDILIWHLRGQAKAAHLIKRLRDVEGHELWVGVLQRAEVAFFMRPEEETATMQFLSLFKTAPVDQKVVDLAGKFYRRWNPSHGTDVNDAILAATAALHGGMIFTLNTRHYPMPEVPIQRAW